MAPFKPTHRITLTSHAGDVRTVDVMHADGAAYTRAEWDADSSADWERDSTGTWTFQGRATPDGVASVQVEAIE